MTWVKTVPYKEATGRLKKLYDRVKGPDNNVDNIMMAHSLRPATMEGHMALYKNVLHHSANKVPKWVLETIGVYVSFLNHCYYCVEHHFEGLKTLLNNDHKATSIREAIEQETLPDVFEGSELAALSYAKMLTKTPHTIGETQISGLRISGLDDGEILEINQVVSYFNYANRTVLGLGIITEGDILGLSPNESDDENNWSHKKAKY